MIPKRYYHTQRVFNIVESNLHSKSQLKATRLNLCHYAKTGDLAALKKLHEESNFTREDFTTLNNLALRSAAQQGHTHVLVWLHSQVNYTKRDILRYGNYPYRIASKQGYHDTINWLNGTFQVNVLA